MFQETFLSLDKIYHIPGWIVYHQDRQGHLGDGLVIAVSSSWSSSHIIFPNFNLDSEILDVKVFQDSLSINIMNVYSSSGNVVNDLSKFSQTAFGPRAYFRGL